MDETRSKTRSTPTRSKTRWFPPLSPLNLPASRSVQESVTYVNRVLAFMFATDDCFEKLMQLPKEPVGWNGSQPAVFGSGFKAKRSCIRSLFWGKFTKGRPANTHTHTYNYIYIYIYVHLERDRGSGVDIYIYIIWVCPIPCVGKQVSLF